ncbi:MAG TPA: SDR family oxidoreductase, partial [archaeon]|nr:SDR family oxidoreductase [archaeon]
QAAFAAIKASSGPIHGLVNNAGITNRETLADTSSGEWNETIANNLSGAFHCAQAALPQLLENKGGAIVSIASIHAILGFPARAAYSASKAGLLGLTRSIAVDYGAQNIRANAVCPGIVRTPMTADWPAERAKAVADMHILRRLGDPKDISAAVRFLLSDEASWITGIVLPVDGGYTAGKGW